MVAVLIVAVRRVAGWGSWRVSYGQHGFGGRVKKTHTTTLVYSEVYVFVYFGHFVYFHFRVNVVILYMYIFCRGCKYVFPVCSRLFNGWCGSVCV